MMLYITIPSYIYNKSFEDREVLPPSNKVLIRVYYEPKFTLIPKWLKRKPTMRYSFEMEPYEIPMLLNMSTETLHEFVKYKADISDWHKIKKVKLRHTIGGIHSRFEITFTNHYTIEYPTLRTESPFRLMQRLPEKMKKNTIETTFADMSGVTFEYQFTDGNLKIINYLKLMNYFGDNDLKNQSVFIIPAKYVSQYKF